MRVVILFALDALGCALCPEQHCSGVFGEDWPVVLSLTTSQLALNVSSVWVLLGSRVLLSATLIPVVD